MTKKEKVVLGVVAVAALLVGLVIGTHLVSTSSSVKSFGSVQIAPAHLVDTGTLNPQGSGFFWDTQSGGGLEVAGQAFFDSSTQFTGTSTFNGPVVASGSLSLTTLSVSGTSTLAGTNLLTGATTISGTASVSQSSSTTLAIGSGVKSGCLEFGDTASTTLTGYIVFTNGSVITTTTKPAACK